VLAPFKTALHMLRTFLDRPNDRLFQHYADWKRQFMYQRLVLGVAIALAYFASTFFLIILNHIWDPQSPVTPNEWINLITVGMLLLCMGWLTSRRRVNLTLVFLAFSWSVSILTEVPETLQGQVDPDISGWTMLFFAQATIMPFRWWLHVLSHLTAYGYYFGVNGWLGLTLFPPGHAPADILFDMVWISGLSTLVVHLFERLSEAEFHTRQELHDEQRRSNQLLRNILPQSVAERLLQEHRTIADDFSDVTVLFADLVDFTSLSANMSPTEIVNLLNGVFSTFDQLAERYQLEKIKTVGDAYMVVAGVPKPHPDHAVAIAHMALAMREALVIHSRQLGIPLHLRIGIHSGPVVAGVIGLSKIAYDLWGDTVNTASRMESHGIPDEIQVTHTTYESLKHHFVLEKRGYVSIKGKGQMVTYLLKGNSLKLPPRDQDL